MDSLFAGHEMDRLREALIDAAVLQAAATIYAAEVARGNYTDDKRAVERARELLKETRRQG